MWLRLCGCSQRSPSGTAGPRAAEWPLKLWSGPGAGEKREIAVNQAGGVSPLVASGEEGKLQLPEELLLWRLRVGDGLGERRGSLSLLNCHASLSRELSDGL